MRLKLDGTTIYATDFTVETSASDEPEISIEEGYAYVDIGLFSKECAKAEREKVWEMAKAINLAKEDGGMRYAELEECFGTKNIERIMKNYSVDEVLEKYESWKKKNSAEELIKSLKPQDVVAVPKLVISNEFFVFMITKITKVCHGPETNRVILYGLWSNGLTNSINRRIEELEEIMKIGRVVETTDILGEIKKIEDEWRKNN